MAGIKVQQHPPQQVTEIDSDLGDDLSDLEALLEQEKGREEALQGSIDSALERVDSALARLTEDASTATSTALPPQIKERVIGARRLKRGGWIYWASCGTCGNPAANMKKETVKRVIVTNDSAASIYASTFVRIVHDEDPKAD